MTDPIMPPLHATDVARALAALPQLAHALATQLASRDGRDATLAAAVRTAESFAAAGTVLAEWAAGVEAKARIVRAAEAEWRYYARALDDVWLQNAAGDLAPVPYGLVRLLADGATLPFALTATATEVIYHQGTTEYCRIPKTLHVVLKDLVVGRPWESPRR
jgi:hypothetical protein